MTRQAMRQIALAIMIIHETAICVELVNVHSQNLEAQELMFVFAIAAMFVLLLVCQEK